ncbi:hypothetical protein NDU88_006525 [Pleurodeles waltl]|uniref:Uncharacterized protein n=1 Tax=Pleurodeles waltl TaxID=8319 RepID=A0AAV7PIZ6_PLEWA|nr:hypothetical protein NDU88_006525 [Pleurodeles waltl]
MFGGGGSVTAAGEGFWHFLPAGAGSLPFWVASRDSLPFLPAGAGSLLFRVAGAGPLPFLPAGAGFFPFRLAGAGSFPFIKCGLDSFPPRVGVDGIGPVDSVADVRGWVCDTLAIRAGWGGLHLCTLGADTDTVGEDTGDMCMAVVEVSASEVCVLLSLVMMLVVDDDVVHAGESVDMAGREVVAGEEGRQWKWRMF